MSPIFSIPRAALEVKFRQAQLSSICRNATFESIFFYQKGGRGALGMLDLNLLGAWAISFIFWSTQNCDCTHIRYRRNVLSMEMFTL